MKRLSFFLIAGAIALVVSACGGGGNTAQPPANETPAETPAEEPATTPETGEFDAAKAEAAYQQSCKSCHGQSLEGAMGPALTTIGATLSKDEIKDILINGVGRMPGGLVTGEDADNLAAWLAAKK